LFKGKTGEKQESLNQDFMCVISTFSCCDFSLQRYKHFSLSQIFLTKDFFQRKIWRIVKELVSLQFIINLSKSLKKQATCIIT